MRRQSHYVVIRTFDSDNAYMPNPFLDAVSSCFVEWLIFSYVIADFVVRKFFESYFGDAVFSNLLFISGKAYGSNYLVGLARE